MGIKLDYKDLNDNYTLTLVQKVFHKSEDRENPIPDGYTNTCSIWDFHPRYEQIMNHLITKKMES